MIRIAYHADGTKRNVHLGGWKRQAADPRDETYRLKLPTGFKATPAAWDNRPICSAVEDQADLGSCTANMFAAQVESNEIRQNGAKLGAVVHATTPPSVTTSNVMVGSDGSITYTTKIVPAAAPTPPAPTPPTPTPTPTPKKLVEVSRLFEYYGTRKIEGTVSEDSGATIRDAIKTGYTYGVADEAAWPYDISKFTVNPPSAVWTAAASHKVTSYHAITDGDLATMKSAIASGYLVGFGFNVYDYFMSAAMASKGFLPVPGKGESLQGGHAVCLVGYDDNRVNPFDATHKGAFLVRNSWGTNWGVAGYFWMAYAYVANTNLCSDFWVVQSSPV